MPKDLIKVAPTPWQVDDKHDSWHGGSISARAIFAEYPDGSCSPVAWVHPYGYHMGTEKADAYVLAAAPEMYEALIEQSEAIDRLFAILISLDPTFYPSKSGQPWEALGKANAARAKAEGRV